MGRCKRGCPSRAILFVYMNLIKNETKNRKTIPYASDNESELTQMTRMGKSIRLKWVKSRDDIIELIQELVTLT